MKKSDSAGMTLIEVVVVLVLIAISTALATGSIRSWQNADNEIDRLALVIETAAERARIRGTPIRFEAQRYAYRFSRLDTTGQWQVIADDPLLVERGLPTGMTLGRVMRDGLETTDGLVFGSDVVIYEIEVISPGSRVTLEGLASGSLLKRVKAQPA